MSNRRLFILKLVFCVSCFLNVLIYFRYVISNSLHNYENNGSDVSIGVNRVNFTSKWQQQELSVFKPLKGDQRNVFQFRTLIRTSTCNDDRMDLLIIVCTSPTNFPAREAIRNTWGNTTLLKSLKAKIVFLIGVRHDRKIQQLIENESKSFRDIHQMDFTDTYRNLTLKSAAMLEWIKDHCVNSTKFVLKVDDDMYINIPNLISDINNRTEEKFIIGAKITGAKPVQDPNSKWYTPKEWFPESVYPQYLSGTAYAMTNSAVPDLYSAALVTSLFWLEDIYVTGLCARNAGIRLIDHAGFTYNRRKPVGCLYRGVISGHEVTIPEMYKIHKEVSDKNVRCPTDPHVPFS